MSKFCENCGHELNENADICLGCGKIINKNIIKTINREHNGYRLSSGIVIILLGLLLVLSSFSDAAKQYINPMLIFCIPGLVGILAGIFTLCSKNQKALLLVSGILLFVAATINCVAISNISIYAITCIVLGIFDILFSRK